MTSSFWLLLAGLCCFVAFFFIPGNLKYLCSVAGGILFAGAYFQVLLQDYRKKAPIPVLGVWVDHKKRPGLYKSIYVFLLFVGAFALFAFCLIVSGLGR